MTEKEEIIRIERLTIAYDAETVLEDVDLTMAKGEILGILGESGCGKSTLLKALIGTVVPVRGHIFIAGEEMSTSDRESVVRARQHIGVVFQAGALIGSMSIADNIALPLRESTDLSEELIEKIVQLKLDMVQLGGKGRLMPAELSGGMKKRAGLARAMALDPSILLCDEPSSGLDPVTAMNIDRLLHELNETLGMTMMIITHEVASIENLSDRCIMLGCEEKGILASGTLDELANQSDHERVRSFFMRRFGRKSAQE